MPDVVLEINNEDVVVSVGTQDAAITVSLVASAVNVVGVSASTASIELNNPDVAVNAADGASAGTADAVVQVSLAETVVQVDGVPGPAGPPGSGNTDDYFQTALRFAELDTPEKKADARTNLELQYIDCGTFN